MAHRGRAGGQREAVLVSLTGSAVALGHLDQPSLAAKICESAGDSAATDAHSLGDPLLAREDACSISVGVARHAEGDGENAGLPLAGELSVADPSFPVGPERGSLRRGLACPWSRR